MYCVIQICLQRLACLSVTRLVTCSMGIENNTDKTKWMKITSVGFIFRGEVLTIEKYYDERSSAENETVHKAVLSVIYRFKKLCC